MLWNITQCCVWSHKDHPFILCQCCRGESVLNCSTRKCKIITDTEHENYYEKSKVKFMNDYISIWNDSNISKHRTWCDKMNWGVTNFGLNTNIFPLSSIAINNLCFRFSIARSVWSYAQNYAERFGYLVDDKFAHTLRIETGENLIYCYVTGKMCQQCMVSKQSPLFFNS